MIGFLLLAVIVVVAFGAMLLLGVPRRLWSLAGAALVLGAAGYAWQGSPGLAATSARPDAEPVAVDPALIDLRERMMGRFTTDAAFYSAAEALLRAGDRDAAAKVMMGGVRSQPQSYMLWSGVGSTLAIHDGDQVSPASLLAFRQAIRLAPNHPAPYFELGLAYVRAGDMPRARLLWRHAFDLSPPTASYRRDIGILLAIIMREPEQELQ